MITITDEILFYELYRNAKKMGAKPKDYFSENPES
jgi:hypothetical protein